jgi:hypothetical protein
MHTKLPHTLVSSASLAGALHCRRNNLHCRAECLPPGVSFTAFHSPVLGVLLRILEYSLTSVTTPVEQLLSGGQSFLRLGIAHNAPERYLQTKTKHKAQQN